MFFVRVRNFRRFSFWANSTPEKSHLVLNSGAFGFVDYKLSTADEIPVVFTGDTQGQAFEITLTFKATEIVATATVTDWVKGGNTEVPIQ